MLADSFQNSKKKSVESDFTAIGKNISLLNFLTKYLPEFSENIKVHRNTDERIINQKLFRFFISKNPLYTFVPENLDETGENISKPDFGVYEELAVYDDNQIRFFDIECKRLYHTSKSKQYVSGKTGGIQRFKENKHGVDLPYSAMIGYVEIENFDFWQIKVNSWILEKFKDETEYLKQVTIDKIAKLKSTHTRDKEKTKIELTHFWLNII